MAMMFSYLLLPSILATTCQSWMITYTHTEIIPRFTEKVNLRCFCENSHDSSQLINEVTRIRVMKMDDDGEWMEYAEIVITDPSEVEQIEYQATDVLVSGHLGSITESYLSLTWPTASEKTPGSYRCEIDGFAVDAGDALQETTGIANIVNKNVTTRDILDLMLKLKTTTEQLSDESLARYQDVKAEIRLSYELSGHFDEQLRWWPDSEFATLSSEEGCPNTPEFSFDLRLKNYSTETNQRPNHDFSSARNLKGPLFDRVGHTNTVTFPVCRVNPYGLPYRPNATWPRGTYCTTDGVSWCGDQFTRPYDTIYFENTNPDGIQTSNIYGPHIYLADDWQSMNIFFCCRSDGSPDTPIILPNEKPFYFYRINGRCQKVVGMIVEEQEYKLEVSRPDNKARGENHPDTYFENNFYIAPLCYYHH